MAYLRTWHPTGEGGDGQNPHPLLGPEAGVS